MKKFLLATAAVLASTSAYAADYAVVHPFYTPAQGKFISKTALDYEHTAEKAKDFDAKRRARDITLSEELKFGVTDDIQVGLFLGRDWGKMTTKNNFGWRETDREHTDAWGIGGAYNIINDGKAFLNVGLSYRQTNTINGRDNDVLGTTGDEHAKFIKLGFTGGYNLDEVTVFGSIAYDRQIDGEKEFNGFGVIENEYKQKLYTLEAGVFKAFNDKISARTSLEIDIEKTKEDEGRTYWWNVGADYSISKKMAVGLNAAYMIDNDIDDHENDVDTHRGYKLGVDFKVEF